MAELLPPLKPQYSDGNGKPLDGGKIWSYVAGTSVPLGTYADKDGLVPNTNPVILDAEGRCDVYIGAASYKFVLMDADDIVIWTKDNVTSVVTAVEAESPWTQHDLTDGQGATDLANETLDLTAFRAAVYTAAVVRGADVIVATGLVYLENVAGVGRARVGMFTANHGVTFTASTAGAVAQLKAEASAGPGAVTIQLSRRLVPLL